MTQKTDNMTTQNYGHAASGMRHAEIAPHSVFRGRLFLTLLMMLLTTATVWADETLTFTFYKDGADNSYITYNNQNYLLGQNWWTTASATVGDVTVTSYFSSNYGGVFQMTPSVLAYNQGYGYVLNNNYASTLTFSSDKYISHVAVYCTSRNSIWTREVDNNTKSCSVNVYKADYAYKVDVTISDTKPTHYYDITYVLNDGTNDSRNPTQYEMSTGVISFYDATRTGYTFDGWFSNSGLTDAITSIPDNSTGNKTLYAGWTAKQYTISFDTNGGTPATIAAITQDYNTTITAPANPSREGYDFVGWSPALPSTMPAGNMTVTAQWTPATYAINYNLAGGELPSGQSNPATYNVEMNTFTLINPTRAGYTFAGWTGSNGTTPQTIVTITQGSSTGILNYTANWTPITYSVAFNGNGSTGGSMDAQSFTYDVTKALTANTFSRAFTVTYAYNDATGGNSEPTATATATFSGWAESENGAKVYDDGQSVCNLTTENNATVNLFAKWTDGSVTLPTPSKTGYTFSAWYSDSGLNTSVGDGGASYTPSEDITIYAKWTVNQYTITFVTGNGGTVIAPLTQDYNTTITAPANPSREGYDFVGWSPALPSTMPAGNMTVTAQWTPTTYTITYNLNGGSLTTDKNSYNIESGEITLDTPTHEGYTFLGWYTNSGLTGTAVKTISTGSTGNKQFWAKWTNQYTIIFVTGNGGTVIAPITQDYGTDVTAPANPSREGYEFTGWDKVIPAKMPAMDMTITAQWKPITYTITYYLNGGSVAANPTSYNIETATFTLNNPTKEHLAFIGWTGSNGDTPQTTVTIAKGSIGDRTYTAHYDVLRFTDGALSYESTNDTELKITACSSNATSVTIPTTVTYDNVTYSVTAIEATAFSSCTSLLVVVLDSDTPPTLGSGAFDGCTALNTIAVPVGTAGTYKDAAGWTDYADKILGYDGTCGANVFYSYDITTQSLHIFGTGAMYEDEYWPWDSYFDEITTVVIDSGVTTIGNSAFAYCFSMSSIEIPASVTTIGNYAFTFCSSLSSVEIPASVTSIGDFTFFSSSLASVEISNGVTTIGESAFQGCTDLTSIEIPASVTIIGYDAFHGCTGLTSVTIHDGVTSISEGAFYDCTSLESVEIPASVTTISANSFSSCTSLASISVADGNPVYDSRNNCNALIETETNTLMQGCKNSVIPDGVTTIGVAAFNGCTGLTSIEIPSGVTSIGNSAFKYCTDLTSIEIPASVTSIGDNAFWSCTSLSSLTIYAPSLSDYYGKEAFFDNASNRKIYVFKNSMDTYKAQASWMSVAVDDILPITGINLKDADDNSSLIEAANDNALDALNVTLQGRTLYKDGEWNTLCLPFDVDLTDENSPLYGATAKTLTDASVMGTTVSLTFGNPDSATEPVTTLTAGTPYIIKWDSDTNNPTITNPVFTNVTIHNTKRDFTSSDDNVKFIGYYDALRLDPENGSEDFAVSVVPNIYYMTAGNTLKHTGVARTLNACRAYFQFSEQPVAARQFVLDFGDDHGDATRLINNEELIINNEAGAWYTLDGVKLNGKPTRKGLYIFNGKLVVIK